MKSTWLTFGSICTFNNCNHTEKSKEWFIHAQFTESSTPCVWGRRRACGTIISILHFCSEAIALSEYITPGDIEQNTSFGFLFSPKPVNITHSKMAPLRKINSKVIETMEEEVVRFSQGSVKRMSMYRQYFDYPLLRKVSDQKQCWHDMKFILWQDGKTPEKISFEMGHFISVKSGAFFFCYWACIQIITGIKGPMWT